MSNYKIRVKISPDDIYNRLSPSDKKRFSCVETINTILLNDGSVIIECLVLKDKIKDTEYLQCLLPDDGYLMLDDSNI